jgi:signal transduction histidine kinase
LPLLILAIAQSAAWLGKPFPGFFLMNNAVVPTVSAFDWPQHRNAVFHSQVVEVDGHAVERSANVYDLVAAHPPDTTLTYTFRKDGKRFEQAIRTRLFGAWDYAQTYGVLLLFGSAWLVFGISVGFLQPHSRQARVFLFQSMVAGLYPITGVFLYQPESIWLSRLYFALECVFPATWIHLAAVFPVDRRVRGATLAVVVSAYALSAVCTITVLRGLAVSPANLAPLHITYLYAAASIVVFLGSLGVRYWRRRSATVRARIKAVLPGTMIAGSLAFFALTNSALSSRSFPVQFGLIFTPIFSAGIAYAIAKHDLFAVDRFVRQSFVYALFSVAIIGGYAFVVSLPPRLVPGAGFSSVRLLLFVALAFSLLPLHRWIQAAVDRAFYRTRLNYRKTIGELSEIMISLLRLDEIAVQLTKVVGEAMHLESAALCLRAREDRPALIWSRAAGGATRELAGQDGIESIAAALDGSSNAHTARDVRERISGTDAPDHGGDLLTRLAAEIVVPLVFQHQVVGFLALGGRLSGQGFDSDDVETLRTLANQTAIAVRNAESYEALDRLNRDLDAKVHEQTEALRLSNDELGTAYDELKTAQVQLVQSEKMASLGQLVAGAAHELNNPASFVHGGLENLSRYLERMLRVLRAYEGAPIADAGKAADIAKIEAEAGLEYIMRETPQLLRICAEGSERIKNIVADLRVFARADRGERAETNVAEGLRSTLGLLGDRLDRAGIKVITDLTVLPPIEANAGQLNQVWMNLLANAVDAVGDRPGGTVRVSAHASDDGVEVEIADNGEGIGAEHLEHIFEPFFTTKPVGSGTGLGLAIAYGAVKSHGGSINVQSERGQGTTFVVHLPFHAGGRPRPSSPGGVQRP